MNEADIHTFFRRLSEGNPNPETELNFKNVYTLLVAVVLSAQSTDVGVNKATKRLFEMVTSPEEMIALGELELKEHIRIIGLFNSKARNIIALSQRLIDDFNGEVPTDRDSLESLPGVISVDSGYTGGELLNPTYDTIEGGYKVPRIIGLRVSRKDCPDLFDDYDYNRSQQKLQCDPDSPYYKRLTKDPDLTTINVKYHRAVIEAWKPIDENPPIPTEDWNNTPESAKQFIRECAIIDHIDSDTRNNHVDNLRWTTPIGNQFQRKKHLLDNSD